VAQNKQRLKDFEQFVRQGEIVLRQYQLEVAGAVLDSIFHRRGDAIVVMFPRQSGKNELQAQIEAYLLRLYSYISAEIVKVSPTWKPQSLNAMRRLERVLVHNPMLRGNWVKESGYIYRVGTARVFFLSGAPESNIVGASATHLLQVDEAQSVLPTKYDRDIAPMAAANNATRLFWGTAWDSQTLLARELRAARQAELRDGRRRAFVLQAEQVAQEAPSYGDYVAGQVAILGRYHPLICTQYFSEELDAQGGMFNPARLARLRGDHPHCWQPQAGRSYAMLLDVAGQEEAQTSLADLDYAPNMDGLGLPGGLRNPRRDASALTIVEVDLSGLGQSLQARPLYRVVERIGWVGERHTALHSQLLALVVNWQARYLVVDATGVGAGLADFLQSALPRRVIPFVFTSKSKSRLGWEFLALVESGRFKDWAPGSGNLPGKPLPSGSRSPQDEYQELFFQQCAACQLEALPGPEQRIRWGVPEGTRRPGSRELLHDDWLISAALCTVLDQQSWGIARSAHIPAFDPLAGLWEAY
jgi:hypothetical protein